MNRFFRRMQSFGKSFSARRTGARRGQGTMVDTSDKLVDSQTPQDVTNIRAKNERKGKVTADKWNQ